MRTPKPSLRFAVGALFLLAAGCGSSTPPDSGDDTTDEGSGGASPGTGGGKPGDAGVAKDAGTGGKAAGGAGGGGAGAGGGASTGGATGTGGSTETPIVEPVATVPVTPKCTGTPVATAPSDQWVNAAGNMNCSNVSVMEAQPCTNMVVAGLWKAGIWGTTNAGASWTHLGDTGTAIVNDGSGDTILNGPTQIIFDPETPTTFWESGMYGWQDPWTMGAFVTHDNGVKFVGYLNMGPKMQSHNDSISVDFHDAQRRTILSGGHEQKVTGGEGLFFSSDAGAYFDDIMSRLPTDVGFCTLAFVLDSQNMLVGCPSSWSGNPAAVLRTSDGGVTWTKVSDKGVVGHALWVSDGTLLWPAENNGGMLKSTDLGKTWAVPAGATKVKQSALELPDGRILSATSDHVAVSADKGETWTTVGQPLPKEGGVTYSAMTKTLYTWSSGCMTAGWDYTK